MTSNTHTAFWSRTPAERNAARKALQSAGSSWGDASGDGIVVTLYAPDAPRVVAAAESVGLTEATRYYTVVRGLTALAIEFS